ncbi:LexA family transcriptional regulator [Vagococcus sp. CY52-2]|uniref:LexA family protein n=1 Tax=Vagococcus sp. CY52-2 TaxID=2925838 RepID=UPI001F5A7DE3|nr:XRE family transcriptional regulator [Vagococcus sp. CY52-2]UNM90592.1 helix-turn-helix domain-containing protein [Vagococcus sp. CY52-2]UNM90646.1 helix-turn-helix domain-containing protein [Vagococcus sp. CY52-2]
MEIKKFIGEKIKYYREKRGLTQEELAKKLKTSRQSISRYESGDRATNQDFLFELADIFEVNIDDFFPPRENFVTKVQEIINIPVLGTITCGEPILAEENIESYREEVADLTPSGTVFFLETKGDSMVPTIPEGSFVLIRQQEEVENNEIAAVLVNGDTEATLKRVKYQGDTMILMPDNKNYEPIIVNEDYPARIIGKAVKVSIDL